MKTRYAILLLLIVMFAAAATRVAFASQTFYVAHYGNDKGADGSAKRPWKTIGFALDTVPDANSVIVVKDGNYYKRLKIKRQFATSLIIKAENPYLARLSTTQRAQVIHILDGASNITIEGFEIFKTSAPTGPTLIQVSGIGTRNITLRGNIIHDSYNNDILKINDRAADITVEGNVFYNQAGRDEHIDVNGGAKNVVIQDNIFFNDFAGSGRVNKNDTSSFIVIKDSRGHGTKNIRVRRNVLLGWEGSPAQSFIRVGEDAKPYHEAEWVMVENNLLIGNSQNIIRAPFTVSGARNITFRANTVAGDMPSLAFCIRLKPQGKNPINQNIYFYNNICSDPAGTMEDFADGDAFETQNAELYNNLYWNGGAPIPSTRGEVFNPKDDKKAVYGDPRINPNQRAITPARWSGDTKSFLSGNKTVREEFIRLVNSYGAIGRESAAIDAADFKTSPMEDILGRIRGSAPDIGAFEYSQAPEN
ncbi:MAG: hypothetical protein ACT4NX_02925 [Deltaproteobacteria bacterium]